MKTRTTPLMLIALSLAFLAFGASNAQALVVIGGLPVGITFGQTARVTAANTGTRPITITGVTFLDSEGNVLGQFDRQLIQPGKMMSFDLNADDIVRESNRIQIRAVIGMQSPPDPDKNLRVTLEVFNNDTGKTTFVIAII